jgi:hypothetical protein
MDLTDTFFYKKKKKTTKERREVGEQNTKTRTDKAIAKGKADLITNSPRGSPHLITVCPLIIKVAASRPNIQRRREDLRKCPSNPS